MPYRTFFDKKTGYYKLVNKITNKPVKKEFTSRQAAKQAGKTYTIYVHKFKKKDKT